MSSSSENALQLYNDVIRYIQAECVKLLSFSKAFHLKYAEEKCKLPYNLNIIDELHINENGHSRILLKLLQFVNEKGKFEFLQSLIYYIRNNRKAEGFDRIKIEQPELSQEKARIDLWVRDRKGGYAIIFENKIYNAKDQDVQIARYIEKTRDEGFRDENIYVIYLSQTGSEPDPQSWGTYQEEFRRRYVNLSFKNDILVWLKNQVLPQIPSKDTYLSCAVIQYIDYLEGLFSLRIIDKTMNMKLETFICQHFKEEMDWRCGNNKERSDFYQEKLDEINELWESIKSIKEKYELLYHKDCYTEVVNDVIGEYEQKVSITAEESYKNTYAAVSFTYKEEPYVVFIDSNGNLYCQIEYNKAKVTDEKYKDFRRSPLAKQLKDLLPESNDFCIWKYFKSKNDETNQFEAKSCFKNVISKCFDLIK